MKMLSATVGGLGVLALIESLVGKFLGHPVMMGVSAGGYLRGASTLFLLALVVMAYGRCYCCASCATPKEPKT
jgi:hypothetical protein